MVALRGLAAPNKGRMQGVGARGTFDTIMSKVGAPEGVTYRPDAVGGVPGWWCIPSDAAAGQALLHCHGGWFNWGTAEAFRHLVGHIAARAKTEAFIPDYRLAPEHPFPSGLNDVEAAYDGLVAAGAQRIVILGDSAGGNLALSLLSILTDRSSTHTVRPAGAVVLSPVTDLTLSGPSWESRAIADPYFTRVQVVELVRSYLAGHDPADPLASPLYGSLVGLPPVRVHVGDDEMLLDDATRYVERAVAAEVDATLDIWNGMPHGFLSGVGHLSAADKALDAIGEFLTGSLASGGSRA
ncbi:alpha/beta hydrolase [Mesorhizobium sp. XAP10]|uniref:alpha/beta hydrolase n=1 Tax=unclassified Mesorhizobium TaxID=325217 RepID=UPI0023E00B75|nr:MULTISPECIES: alpha/beta hydrolase [unclassified Mesorhizobium]MDF3154550.1 alpha/beta hydrolase [Mesorhizobium sp. XAP10]MDF3247900.1 alpha/beta hydrolase [Mesorhizobium sp. XAP4]